MLWSNTQHADIMGFKCSRNRALEPLPLCSTVYNFFFSLSLSPAVSLSLSLMRWLTPVWVDSSEWHTLPWAPLSVRTPGGWVGVETMLELDALHRSLTALINERAPGHGTEKERETERESEREREREKERETSFCWTRGEWRWVMERRCWSIACRGETRYRQYVSCFWHCVPRTLAHRNKVWDGSGFQLMVK